MPSYHVTPGQGIPSSAGPTHCLGSSCAVVILGFSVDSPQAAFKLTAGLLFHLVLLTESPCLFFHTFIQSKMGTAKQEDWMIKESALIFFFFYVCIFFFTLLLVCN